VSVWIYVEGGGGGGDVATRCRRGFAEFFRKIVAEGRQPKIIACGSRGEALHQFQLALIHEKRATMVLLLVDSEGPVAEGISPWAHLKQQDGWAQPRGSTDGHLYLMVLCLEAWFLADKGALAGYYGQGFRRNALPRHGDIEQVPKDRLLQALQQATGNTTKGKYHKTEHGFEMLMRIVPERVRDASAHFRRLCEVLAKS
jgi:hypothetical protein